MSELDLKAAVGKYVADTLVKTGMKLGLGTGTTAIWAVRRLGERIKSGQLAAVLAVPTSFQTERECQQLGIPVRSLNDPEIDGRLDLAIDGADEVDPRLCLTKGGGGALLLEKIVAYAADKIAIVVDHSKLVKNLGLSFPIALEVVPQARTVVIRALQKLGAKAQVREAERKIGPVITDNGNILIDIKFQNPIDPRAMENSLNQIPGVVENGLFSHGNVEVFAAYPDGRIDRINRNQ